MILNGMGEATAKFAVLMKISFDESAIYVAKFAESLGIADRDVVKFMDVLQKMKGAAGVEVQDLYYTFKYMGGDLKNLGLQGLQASKDIGVLISMLAMAGIEGSTPGTGFSSLIQNISTLKSKMATKRYTEQIEPLLSSKGISFKFFDDKGEFAGIQNMVKEFEKLKVFSAQQKGQILSGLFDENAMKIANVFINSGMKGFSDMQKRMENQASMQEKIKLIMDSLKMKWDTITGTVQNFVAHIGQIIAKSADLKNVFDKANNFIGFLDEWVQKNPVLVEQIVKVTAGIAGILLLVGGAGALFAGIAELLVLIMTPAGIVGAVLAGAGVLILASWDKVKAFFIKIQPYFKAFVEGFLIGFLGISKSGEGIKETLINAWEKIKVKAQPLIDTIKDIWVQFQNLDWKTIGEMAGVAFNYIAQAIIFLTSEAVANFIGTFGKMVSVLWEFLKAIGEAVTFIGQFVGLLTVNPIEAFKFAFLNLSKAIEKTNNPLVTGIARVGQFLGMLTVDPIAAFKNAFLDLGKAIEKLNNPLANAIALVGEFLGYMSVDPGQKFKDGINNLIHPSNNDSWNNVPAKGPSKNIINSTKSPVNNIKNVEIPKKVNNYGGGISINYAPVINGGSGGVGSSDIKQALKENSDYLVRLIQREFERDEVRSF